MEFNGKNAVAAICAKMTFRFQTRLKPSRIATGTKHFDKCIYLGNSYLFFCSFLHKLYCYGDWFATLCLFNMINELHEGTDNHFVSQSVQHRWCHANGHLSSSQVLQHAQYCHCPDQAVPTFLQVSPPASSSLLRSRCRRASLSRSFSFSRSCSFSFSLLRSISVCSNIRSLRKRYPFHCDRLQSRHQSVHLVQYSTCHKVNASK